MNIRVAAIMLVMATLVISLLWYLLAPRALHCPAQLKGFIDCTTLQMPGAEAVGTDAPTPPDEMQRQALAQAAQQLFHYARSNAPGCDFPLPETLASAYQVTELHSKRGRYCALWEGRRGWRPRGWGTVLVNRAPQRDLVFGVPHPRHDLDTLEQAVTLLDKLQGLALVIAGSHRDALPAPPECPAWPYTRSDATHHLTGYFSLARGVDQAASGSTPAWRFLEWHGMRSAAPGEACFDDNTNRPLDVFISSGRSEADPGTAFAINLAASLQAENPAWSVATPADRVDCDKAGSANLLGRYLNGAQELRGEHHCRAAWSEATRSSGRFIHIEQSRCSADDCDSGSHIRSADAWLRPLQRATQSW